MISKWPRAARSPRQGACKEIELKMGVLAQQKRLSRCGYVMCVRDKEQNRVRERERENHVPKTYRSHSPF